MWPAPGGPGPRLDTAGLITARELGHRRLAEYVEYDPSRWLALRIALGRRGLGPDDVFVDLGSGKGQVVLRAARRFRCRRVIGDEISVSPVKGTAFAEMIDRLLAMVRRRGRGLDLLY